MYLIFILVAVCYEPNPYCPLVEFILERSVKNMQVIGFQTFWFLRSWMHLKMFRVKLSVICQQLLMICGSARQKIYDQHRTNQYLKEIATTIAPLKGSAKMEPLKVHFNTKKKPDHLPEVCSGYPQGFIVSSRFFD